MKCNSIIILFLVLNSALSNKHVEQSNGNEKLKGNILCIMTVMSPSHHIWNGSLMRALAKDGYNVTAVSVDIDQEPTENLHYIHLERAYEEFSADTEDFIDFVAGATLGPIETLKIQHYKYSRLTCFSVFKSNGLKLIFQYPRTFKFDLVIFEMTFGPCLLPLIDRFPKAPVIGVTPTPPYASEYTGTPLFPSFVPHYFLQHQGKMNFLQRSYNLLVYLADSYYRKKMINIFDGKLREIFGTEMKYLGSYEQRTEILLVNSHPSMQPLQPLLPSVIQVGGLHITDPKPLTEDIETFISSGIKGSVLFSLGTNVKSELLGEERIEMFINVIRRFPEYNFLWKFEADTLPYIPKNLIIKKWISQNDILAHPNIKLFMSHCGLLSSQEATWHGVPVLALPFVADQHQNSHLMLENGLAEIIDMSLSTEEIVYNTMKKMLENPIYAQNMQQRSIQFKDRPQHPLDLALFWCKYILHNGDAKHLRSPAIEMSHFEQHMWDVLLVLVCVVIGVLLLIRTVIISQTQRRSTVKVKSN